LLKWARVCTSPGSHDSCRLTRSKAASTTTMSGHPTPLTATTSAATDGCRVVAAPSVDARVFQSEARWKPSVASIMRPLSAVLASRGGPSGIIGRSGQLVPFPRTATIVPNRLNHIIQEHTKGIRGKGQFASGANPSAIQGLINTILSRGSLNRKPQGALRLCMNMILAILSVRVDGVVSRVLRSAS